MHFKRINIDLDRFKPSDPDTSRFFIVSSIALILFMALCAALAFFLALRGAEKTMVPDLRGMELASALIEMQEKELYPRLQLRYSNSVEDKGLILEQNPGPGAIVKAGRRINLVVSRGAVVDKVGNYIGQSENQVRLQLQTLFSNSARPLISIQEPPVYVFNAKPQGTVLEQKPLPDSALSNPVQLVLVISRGPEKARINVPSLVGLGLEAALREIEATGSIASFTSRKREGGEAALSVSAQLPSPGTSVPSTTRISLVVTEPEKKADYVFGIFKQSLPEYPYPLKLTVQAVLPNGDRKQLFEQNHPGGDFSLPYELPSGSQLILSILGQEKSRLEVGGKE